MTPLELLDVLQSFIEEKTKDIKLPVRVSGKNGEEKERPAEVFKMALPDKSSGTKRIPYVLLQFLKSADNQSAGENPESFCKVRIVIATYSENGEEGALCALNLMTRIRVELLKKGMLDDRFILKGPLEMIYYPDDTAPYYLGEMMTSWKMPAIESEVIL